MAATLCSCAQAAMVERRIDPDDGRPHTFTCFTSAYPVDGEMRWEEALPVPGLNIPARESRGGGAHLRVLDAFRPLLIIPTINGIPQYTLTAGPRGGQSKVDTIKRYIQQLPAEYIDTNQMMPHHPFFGVFGFKMHATIFADLAHEFGHKDLDSTRKIFTQLGFRYRLIDGMEEFNYDLEGHKKHGWKMQRGVGSCKPNIVFEEVPAS